MTFEEWWKIRATDLEISEEVSPYSLMKGIARDAWEMGGRVAGQRISKLTMNKETGHLGFPPSSQEGG